MPLVPSRFATSVLGRLPEPVRRRASSATGRRMFRFAPAAAVALAASQVTYFLCGSVWHLTGRVTGAAGWLAGALVSYLVSRWAWERRGRPRLLAETLPFVAISVATGAVLIEASHLGYREAGALGLHGMAFYLAAQGFYLAANVVTFVGRFVIFNFVLFADRSTGPAGAGRTGTVAPCRGLPGRLWRLAPEVTRFSVVGGCAWLVSGAVVSVLRVQAGAGPLAASAAALVVATVVSFTGNRYWTFRHRARTTLSREGFRYLLLTGAGLVIQLACLRLAAGAPGPHDGLPYGIALATAIGLPAVFRYWSCRAWVWRATKPALGIAA
jgi:putative flippase GtrA